MSEEQKIRFFSDRGYASRKFTFALLALVIILVGFVAAGRWPALGANYEAMIGGTIGVLALYLTGNVGNKWVLAKEMIKQATTPPATEPCSPEVDKATGPALQEEPKA